MLPWWKGSWRHIWRWVLHMHILMCTHVQIHLLTNTSDLPSIICKDLLSESSDSLVLIKKITSDWYRLINVKLTFDLTPGSPKLVYFYFYIFIMLSIVKCDLKHISGFISVLNMSFNRVGDIRPIFLNIYDSCILSWQRVNRCILFSLNHAYLKLLTCQLFFLTDNFFLTSNCNLH